MQVPPPDLFLGLDLSTQQLKAALLSEEFVYEAAVHFDRDLPNYGTVNGIIRGPGAGEVTSPVSMWLEAIDVLLDHMKSAGVDFSAITAVCGAAQQHGSVYWSADAEESLSALDASQPLLAQLFPKAFSLPNAPIWLDSSTTHDCRVLEERLGGPQALSDLTGSRAYERFTGPQIAKLRRLRPDVYQSTARISLVSSFLSSLFLGRIAPIEVSDASGMNLMNLTTCKWDDRLLECCGGDQIYSKLGPEPVHGGTVLGTVSDWWVKRWGFRRECIVAPFTGDNPATVASLSAPGDAILSLGTSTTFLLSIPPSSIPPKRYTTSHLLAHPTTPGAHIAMLCYKNGALAREQVRDSHAGGNWDRFNQQVEESPPGNNGFMGLYYPIPEIIPPNILGTFLFSFQNEHQNPMPAIVDSIPSEAHPRAILESQFLSIRSHIADILPRDTQLFRRLVITGGSSVNQAIQQVVADVFGTRVYVTSGFGNKEAACAGGAVLAKMAWWKQKSGGRGTGDGVDFCVANGLTCVAEPDEEASRVYDKLLEVYRSCEEEAIRVHARFKTTSPTSNRFSFDIDQIHMTAL